MADDHYLGLNVEWPYEVDGLQEVQEEVEENYKKLKTGDVPGAQFLGWKRWPLEIQPKLRGKIDSVASEIRDRAELYISAGIGGSYLGGRAVVEALAPHRELEDAAPEIHWAGHQLSGKYHSRLLQRMEDKSTYLNVISKSGTTTETALAFRLLVSRMKSEYKDISRRVVVTTSRDSGALVEAAEREGFRSFVIPEDIGGRFSVFTPVGLLPAGVAGVELGRFIEGASGMARQLLDSPEQAVEAIHYAAARNYFYRQGGKVEILANFYPELSFTGDWWQQLFGESEGKENEGLYPATVDFTTDLHSLGQYIQQGPRHLLETMIRIKDRDDTLEVPAGDSADGLDYLTGQKLSEINHEALEGTREAHLEGGVPVITMDLPRLDAYWLGGLLYFFQFSCALSGMTLGVNPFNQPGVEAYKNNMYRRLGKPGFDE